jgi:hypothetical protein
LPEGYDKSDFSFPRIRLLQAVSDEALHGVAPAGRFYHTLVGDVGPEVDVVALAARKTRARFVNRALLCQSLDFVTGRGDPGGDCMHCPLSQWGEPGPDGKPLPPACSLTHNFFVVPVSGPAAEFPVPALMQFTRSGIKTARKLNSALAIAQAMGQPPWKPVLRFRVIQQQGGKGSYYAAVFTFAGTTPQEDWPKYAEAAKLVLGTLASTPEAAIEHTAEDLFPDDAETAAGNGAGAAATSDNEPLNF